ncbi:MAG: DUF1549 and DUF1553 domain-containing protein [Pirellulaceae bacterium]
MDRARRSYEPHWAFRPLRKPTPPTVPGDSWSQRPIDRFVTEPLRARGLAPSPRASRETLLRRLSLDLRGLPPDSEELGRFLADPRPDAEARLVDRLLSSPHFGERWGRHWLDQARYADSHGYTVDGERTMWPYRDWVMQAINDDMPFDQFTIEQLAGDMLPDASVTERVATGFHRNTLINQEGGSDPEQFRVEAVVDRVNTTGSVWLGLTVGCAQCHNHKYDPLTQREFYQLYAFFNSGTDVNNGGATVAVPTIQQSEQLLIAEQRLAAATQLLEQFDRDHPELVEPLSSDTTTATRGATETWSQIEQPSAETNSSAMLVRQEDGAWLATGNVAPSDAYRIQLRTDSPTTITSIRLETLTDPSLPQQGPGRAGNGNFVLCELNLRDGRGTSRRISGAIAEHSQDKYPVADAIDGDIKTGWAINVGGNSQVGPLNSNRTAWFALETPLELSEGETAELELVFGDQPAGYPVGKFRVSVTSLDARELGFDSSARRALVSDVEAFKQQREQLSRAIPRSMVMADLPNPRESFVLLRGDFLRRGDPVVPATPAWLPALPQESDERLATRLDLAKWLVADEQPLTPRVTVNRMWMRLFGRGLVETENDFGAQGSTPTHPRLLEFLAADFIERDWSRKNLVRSVVLSATYQQDSYLRDDLAELDPNNLTLARQSRVRVEGEVVRDLALASSGVLSRQLGGPSVHPPQPAGVFAFTQRAGSWPESQGAARYRRGMYTFFYRSAPYPLLTTFDAPKFETTCTRRVRSNTPLQSLTLSNDAVFLELAGAWGARLARGGSPDRSSIESMFREGFSRSPNEGEVALLLDFAAAERERFESDSAALDQWLGSVAANRWNVADSKRLDVAVWSSLARIVFNLDEFITRE